jgi:hypothetical protein
MVIVRVVRRSRPKVFAVAGVGAKTPQGLHSNQRALLSPGAYRDLQGLLALPTGCRVSNNHCSFRLLCAKAGC